jgi:hypothetical protein
MEYLKTFENYNNRKDEELTKLIIKYREEFSNKYNCSYSDINKGNCVDFVDVIEDNFSDKFETLTTNMFIPNDDVKDHLIKTYNDVMLDYDGVEWSKNMLDEYGYPDEFFMDEEPMGHIWIYYNGKHYDAEEPYGVDTPWELPFFNY